MVYFGNIVRYFGDIVRRRLPHYSLIREQHVAHLHFCFVQLRLRVPDRALQQLSNLVVLVALDLVQIKYLAASGRQLFDCATQGDAIHRTAQAGIISSNVTL